MGTDAAPAAVDGAELNEKGVDGVGPLATGAPEDALPNEKGVVAPAGALAVRACMLLPVI